MEIKTVGELLHWSYANLAMAHSAIGAATRCHHHDAAAGPLADSSGKCHAGYAHCCYSCRMGTLREADF
jgi:hypothetical protein